MSSEAGTKGSNNTAFDGGKILSQVDGGSRAGDSSLSVPSAQGTQSNSNFNQAANDHTQGTRLGFHTAHSAVSGSSRSKPLTVEDYRRQHPDKVFSTYEDAFSSPPPFMTQSCESNCGKQDTRYKATINTTVCQEGDEKTACGCLKSRVTMGLQGYVLADVRRAGAGSYVSGVCHDGGLEGDEGNTHEEA